ncbi:uncharacterized protein LOC129592670 [Paramacrobiotus metropolitanus]|uniref:uncharacterized protein LOC129592670 n=1 Tax=Paramacrobiotus metropolitanus TaxID=2943436 RepID=UPI0024460472|nr:uncharacterized protein LOC129592670 [Paramacrobiotus metropolitanus]XP_055344734.1 uncharacterized protein LOC129592670 [Paramacrobiotus metropolitanus]
MAFTINNGTAGEFLANLTAGLSHWTNMPHPVWQQNVSAGFGATLLNSSASQMPVNDPEAWRQTAPWSGNYTKQQRDDANMLYIVLYPLLLASCTIGNTLNLIVLICEKRKASTNCYMTAVALADIVILWMGMPLYAWNTSATLLLPHYVPRNKKILIMVLPYTIWAQETLLHLCDWTLIVFSLERLLAITQPFSIKWLQSARTARIVIVVLFVLSMAFAVNNYVAGWYPWMYSIMPEWLADWSAVQDKAEMVVTCINFFGLLIINLLVIAAIRRQHLSDIGQQRAAQTAGQERRYRNSNYLLIGSVGLYLFTMLPSLVYKILIVAETNQLFNFHKTAKLFATPFCLSSSMANYSVNFFLYLTVSERYRVQFVRLFAGVFCPEWLKRNAHKYKDTSSNFVATFPADGARSARAAAYKPGITKMKTVDAIEDKGRHHREHHVMRRTQSEMPRNDRECEDK